MYPPQQPMYGQPGYTQPGFIQPGPMYNAPPPPMYMQPPQQQGPTIIHINNDDDDGTMCNHCGKKSTNVVRRKVGCTAIAWGICLFWFTGILCCIPCCMDGCKDSELVCVNCQNVKGVIEARCC